MFHFDEIRGRILISALTASALFFVANIRGMMGGRHINRVRDKVKGAGIADASFFINSSFIDCPQLGEWIGSASF